MVLASLQSFSQVKSKVYNLYYFNDKGSNIYQTGIWFRNDTLFVELNALVNVVNIRRVQDSTIQSFPLGPIRDPQPKVPMPSMESNKIAIISYVKKDTVTKNKQKTKGKN